MDLFSTLGDAAAWTRAHTSLVLVLYGGMSVVTFVAFAWDKLCAKLQRRRVPEAVLHTLELGCGWPGALAGQLLLRHKSEKLSYRVVLWAIVALHLGLLAYVATRG